VGGLVNYITIVEEIKERPHFTILLRICMNSSLRQPKPAFLSLNNCLIKGLSVLMDLFTATLGIREHMYALIKDLSKFYQRVDADPLVQCLNHVGSQGLRGGNEMHVTTTVNVGVKPAVCITIVAARETDERFGGGYPEAACFLTHRAYVDDATFRAHPFQCPS
jgi:hypothetical protein